MFLRQDEARGGVYITGGDVTITDCNIYGNAARSVTHSHRVYHVGSQVLCLDPRFSADSTAGEWTQPPGV